jgi:hypothetical protein
MSGRRQCVRDFAVSFAISIISSWRGAFGAQRQRLAKATAPKQITLQKPPAISGADEAWFDRFYKADTQAFRDRVVFST